MIAEVEAPKERKKKKSINLQKFKYPTLLESTGVANVWYVSDISMKVPKVNVRFLVRYLESDRVENLYTMLRMIVEWIEYDISMKMEEYLQLSMDRVVV